jgi:hypothetical protein
MIKRRTLFILGAGASMPYGFPSGAALKEWLCDAPKRASGQLLQEHFGTPERAIVHFANTLRASGQSSIDSFLARRLDFTEIGKLCIAAELCRCEVPKELQRLQNPDHWYALLWEALQRDAERLEDIRTNTIKIVTFNYDRSLEFFLFEAIKHTFGVNDDLALAALDSLPIIHAYGSTGQFSAEKKMGYRTFDHEDLSAYSLRTAAQSIRVIPESREGDPAFQEAQKAVIWCQTLCFLGFGFDFLNLARLNIPSALKDRGANGLPWILTSAVDKTEVELDAYRQRVCGGDNKWTVYTDYNSMTLRKSGVLL